MKISELAEEYGESVNALRGRIRQLEQEKSMTEDEDARFRLDGRLRPLRAMYRETRSVARHLERYYARLGREKDKEERQ